MWSVILTRASDTRTIPFGIGFFGTGMALKDNVNPWEMHQTTIFGECKWTYRWCFIVHSVRSVCVCYYRRRDNRAERPVCLNRSTCRQCVCVCLSDCLSAISTYIDDVARGGNNAMYTFLNGWMVCKILSIDTTVCSKLHRDKHMPRSFSHRISFHKQLVCCFCLKIEKS